MDSDRNGNSNSSSTLKPPIKINIEKKINKTLKNDLNALDKVINGALMAKSANRTKKPVITESIKPPNKIDLNLDLSDLTDRKADEIKLTDRKSIPKPNQLNPLPVSTRVDKNALLNQPMNLSISEIQQKIPTHKYPFVKEERVGVDELRSKIYHGTMGVVPVRQSQQIQELNFVMKGRPVKNALKNEIKTEPGSNYDNDYYYFRDVLEKSDAIEANQNESMKVERQNEDDEGIVSTEEEEFKIHANLNTPATNNIFEMINNGQLTSYFESQSSNQANQRTFQNYLDEIKRYREFQPKPAILSATGTSGTAKLSSRPKPPKKFKTLKSPIRRLAKLEDKKNDSSMYDDDDYDLKDELSIAQQHQIELENEVRELVNEAKKIAKVSERINKRRLKSSNRDGSARETGTEDSDRITDLSNIDPNNLNQKLLLKSVEGLITAIKSGQLIKEQEQSNKRIQEILGSVLDQASLGLLDPSFNVNTDNLSEIPSVRSTDQIDEGIVPSETATAKESQAVSERSKLDQLEHKNLTDQSQMTNLSSNRQKDPYYMDTERDGLLHQQQQLMEQDKTARSYALSYEEEIDLFLASLPHKATNEEVLNTTASKATLFNKVTYKNRNLVDMAQYNQSKEKDHKNLPETSTEDKFSRNMHLFCMLEHERRDLLLLPDELADVTRKYHTRNKYDPNKSRTAKSQQSNYNTSRGESFISAPSKRTLISQKSNISVDSSNLTLKQEMNNRANDAAQRVFDNLADLMRFKQKSQLSIDNISVNDSGIGDENSLDSWRVQAEQALSENFVLDAKKAPINVIDNMADFSLTFLRPAPPKMSVKPSQIRENLFPQYKSLPPPIDDLNLLSRKSKRPNTKRTIKFATSTSKDNSSHLNLDDLDEVSNDPDNEEETDEDNDEDLLDDSDLYAQIITEKILHRRYNSETDLSKFRPDLDHSMNKDEDYFIFNEVNLVRTLSDSIINKNKTKNKPKFLNEMSDEEKDDENDEFLKIDSNYNDAIEEVICQKAKIKEAYLKKKKNLQSHSETTVNVSKAPSPQKQDKIIIEKTPDSDDEIKNIDAKSISTYKTDHQSDKEYFPKTKTRTLAEIALEAGRNYILNPPGGKKKKRNKKYNTFTVDKLNKIESQIFNSNIKYLNRSQSVEKLKSRGRQLIDTIFLVGNKDRFKRRSSIPGRFDFEEYKTNQDYRKSKWSMNRDTFFNNEREWVRDIWNLWFDEVIPQLDGSGGRPSSSLQNKRNRKKEDKNTGEEKTDENGENGEEQLKNNDFDDDDDDDPTKAHRVVKSPTPYINYPQIEFINEDDRNVVDLEMIQIVENEIEKLSKRIEVKANAFDLARRGTLYRKLGFIKLALDDIMNAIDLEENFVDAYWQRHLIYLVQDKKVDAMNDLNTIIRINRFHPGAYLSRGILFAERNDTSNAIFNFSQTIKFQPNDFQAYFRRAKMYEIRGDVRMAMDDYLTTTKLNPKVHEAWFKHGMSYYNNKNWHYAIVDFSELIRHNPANQAEARLYRGKCYLNLEEYQLAFEDFTVALHLNPNDWQSYYHRGCLLRRIDPKQALQDFSISLLIESGYDNMSSFLHRGILYTDNERYDEAIKDFESVLQLDKEFSPAYVNLGIIYMNLTMNYWMAIKQFNLAIKSNPVYIRAYLCRAQAYRYIHDLKSAYIDYTKAIHLDPLNTQIYIYRGQVILEMGNLELAAFCVQHAAFMNEDIKSKKSNQLNDDSSLALRALSGKSKANTSKLQYHSSSQTMSLPQTVNQSVTQRAIVFSFLKNYNKAIEILEHELRIKPSTEIYNLLGRVFMKAKKWEDAVLAFERSIELNLEDTKNPNQSYNTMSSFNQSFLKPNALSPKVNRKDLVDAYFMRGQSYMEVYKFSEALMSFDKVIELKPNNAQAYYCRGLTKVHLNHPKCIQDFNKALAINPNLFEAFLARACIYGMQDRFTKAILNCNQAVKLNPKSVRGYLYRGALKYLSRSYEYAILDLTEAIKLDQTCAVGYFNRALCYRQLKQYRNALKDFSIVLMLGEYLKYKVCINRALLYFEIKDYSNSLRDFKMAAEFFPEDHNIQHMIGVCLHKLERYQESIDKLTETYHLNTNFHDALISRGNVYVDFGTDEAFQRAQKDYEHVLLKDSRNIDAHINLSYLYQIIGKFKLAWDQFTTAIQIKPDFAPCYEGRSIVCLQMRNTDAALKDINQAIKLKPTAELFVNRGVIYQFTGDNVNAMRDYQTAILLNKSYGLAYYNSANIFLLHKQYIQAIKHLDMAIDKCDMKDESTYQNRAIAKALNSDTAGAFRDLCESIKYGKFSAHIFMNRGLLLYKMENFSLAEKDLTTAINLSPNDPLLYKLRADCRGKLELKEEAIADYKIAIDLQFRQELKKYYLGKA